MRRTIAGANESYTVTYTYGEDLDGDGFDDIGIRVALSDPASNPTEDLIGVAFDFNSDATTSDLQTTDINLLSGETSYVTTTVIDPGEVADGINDPPPSIPRVAVRPNPLTPQ